MLMKTHGSALVFHIKNLDMEIHPNLSEFYKKNEAGERSINNLTIIS